MNSSKEHFRRAALAAAFVLVGLILVHGCKKSEPEPTTRAVETVEHTTCPVMGGAINTAIFTEYKGKKVYFCCDPCKEKFEAAPEQYIAKLPQFNQ